MNTQNPIGTYGYIAMKRLKSAEKNLDIVHNRMILNDIAYLKRNWDDNKANPFALSLIEKCTNIINQLEVQSFISPTACGAIQMEYEKENGDYLELEVYSERIEVYQVINNIGHEETLTSSNFLNEVNWIVSDFLKCNPSKD